MIQNEPEPVSFFNIEYKGVLYDSYYEDVLGLKFTTKFVLSDVSKTYEREVYSFMEALGDFGGFNDGIVLFPAIFMSIYAEKMFHQNLFSQLPLKN